MNVQTDTGPPSNRLYETDIKSRWHWGLEGSGHFISVHSREVFPVEQESDLPNKHAGCFVFILPFTAAHTQQMERFSIELAKSGIHCVIVDLPGHGRSGGSRGQFEVQDFFPILYSLMNRYREEFDCRTIHLLGSSWGGDLGLLHLIWEEFKFQTESQPKLLSSVISQAVITPWLRDIFRQFRPGISIMYEPSGLANKLLQKILGKRIHRKIMFSLDEIYHNAELKSEFSNDNLTLDSYDTKSYLEYLYYLPQFPNGLISTPISIVIGSEDQLVPLKYEKKVFEKLGDFLSHHELIEVENAGHGMFQEEAGRITPVILDWIERSEKVEIKDGNIGIVHDYQKAMVS